MVNQYRELLSQAKDIITRLKAENASLRQEVYSLQSQLDAIEASPLEVDFQRFVKMLGPAFSSDAMPKASGIYAYYNATTEQVYIGQSVNMHNRLKQHFRKGKISVSGHDSEFKDMSEWTFHVLEYINRDDKSQLNDREAYWIALAKVATDDKRVIDTEATAKLERHLQSNAPHSSELSGIELIDVVKGQGEVTNRTRGNNVRM